MDEGEELRPGEVPPRQAGRGRTAWLLLCFGGRLPGCPDNKSPTVWGLSSGS